MSRFLKKLYLAIAVPCALNLPLFLGMLEQLMEKAGAGMGVIRLLQILAAVLLVLTYLWLLVWPVRDSARTEIGRAHV